MHAIDTALMPYPLKPLATLKPSRPIPWWQERDRHAVREARRIRALLNDEKMSGTKGTWQELMYINTSDYAATNTFSSETSLLTAGPNLQPIIPANYFDESHIGRTIIIEAFGVLGSTGTPTYTFQLRLGTTSGSTFLSGTSIGVTAAITTASSVSNKWWHLRHVLTLYTAGIGTGNTTLSGAGYIVSPGGFATPFMYPFEPTTPDTATWTATIDNSLTQFLNLSCTCSSSNSSNTLTVKKLMMHGCN